MGVDFVSFAEGLRAALREDPDVIMVGEMRDPETMEAALLAAETGHLVFSTVHTIGAKDTVDRIINAFPQGYQNNVRAQLASILRGVISQTLMPHASGKGRVAAFEEIMVGTPALANLIRENNFALPPRSRRAANAQQRRHVHAGPINSPNATPRA